jgi:DNA-directed RNA polymerase subunit RPC12/RpoP
MANKGISYKDRLRPTCINCGNKYDLNNAVTEAERKRTNIIRCPHCDNKVGTST